MTNRYVLHSIAAVDVLLIASNPVLGAQERSWFGHWTLHRELSRFTGSTLTIGRTPHGYRFDFGAVAFDIGDDGAFYPTIPTRTTSIKPIGSNQWFRVHRTNGKEVDRGTLTVAPDDKSLLIHTIATAPDGSIHVSDETMDRIGAGTGLAGTWRSTSAGVNVSPAIIVEPTSSGQLRWALPDEGQFYVFRPDGAPVTLQGPRSAPNVTIAFRSSGPNSMSWTEFINGKPLTEGTDVLSPDGQHLTETSWSVQQPHERQEAVYAR